METALALAAVASFGLDLGSSIFGASAKRKAARAQMAALEAEKTWNLGVMRRNKADVYASNILQSWGSGINYTTGSTAAVIANNQQVLEEEIKFQEQQYNTQIANLRAQSKKKHLGIF